MTLTAQIGARIAATLAATADLSTPTDALTWAPLLKWTSGTGVNQADRIYHRTLTINASTTTTLDLSGGALEDALGQGFTLAKLKAIGIYNTHATQGVTLTRPAANGVPFLAAAGDAIPVPAGGLLVLAAGGLAGLATVTAGTGDLIDLVNGAGSAVTLQIVLIGTSA